VFQLSSTMPPVSPLLAFQAHQICTPQPVRQNVSVRDWRRHQEPDGAAMVTPALQRKLLYLGIDWMPSREPLELGSISAATGGAFQPHPVRDVLMAAVSAAADVVDVLHEGLHVLHGHILTP